MISASSILYPISSILFFAYSPFLTPLPIWNYWPLLLFPLCALVAIVYKSIKCASMDQVPREATALFIWILIGMVAAGAVLTGIVKIMERV